MFRKLGEYYTFVELLINLVYLFLFISLAHFLTFVVQVTRQLRLEMGQKFLFLCLLSQELKFASM